MKHLKPTLSAVALALGLAACGGSSDDSNNEGSEQSAKFSLGVSDAAVEGASEVNIFVKQITLRNDAGEDTVIETTDENNQPEKINLLDFQGSAAYQLVTNLEVEAGDYQWIRMDIVNGTEADITQTSHIVFEDASVRPLVVSRKGNDGVGEIQLNDFELNQGENSFVVEFDLKRSLVDPQNNQDIKLKPTGVRLENLISSGHISGSISAEVIGACEVDNASFAGTGGEFGHAVYLYDDDVTAQTALDIDDTDSELTPHATASLVMNSETGDYDFEFGFVGEGDYSLGYTCVSHLDDAENMDEDFSLYAFKGEPVNVEANVTSSTSLALGDIIEVEINVETEAQAQ
ncbi:DUF4382 domain-containing protein [Catenovulum sp. 2E275]|uniref:DUF4382 domain-containing protein n=1 Tax=Catenovulum sp. 2E275 TaxID=2980497 RepID=UPI0021CE7168|nr:DUF4382 domain-containing protein [Catenovulum sp. 2E275]MCU4675196.1 DUF4382 domain-containing protein [Catenovulum sp. 2E275]